MTTTLDEETMANEHWRWISLHSLFCIQIASDRYTTAIS